MNNANSLLFVPGSRPERFDKALEAGADIVIIDLEDAVSPADKDTARAALAAWLDPAHPVLVRINAAETQWFEADLGLLASAGIAGVVLPKAERPEDIAAASRAAGHRRSIVIAGMCGRRRRIRMGSSIITRR